MKMKSANKIWSKCDWIELVFFECVSFMIVMLQTSTSQQILLKKTFEMECSHEWNIKSSSKRGEKKRFI